MCSSLSKNCGDSILHNWEIERTVCENNKTGVMDIVGELLTYWWVKHDRLASL